MRRAARARLLAAVLVALVLVLLAWYRAGQPRVYKADSLVRIDYTPDAPPHLTFWFATPLDILRVSGSTATLRAFRADPGTADPALLSLQALPFVPTLVGEPPKAVATNTMPRGAPPGAITLQGRGEVWFTTPR